MGHDKKNQKKTGSTRPRYQVGRSVGARGPNATGQETAGAAQTLLDRRPGRTALGQTAQAAEDRTKRYSPGVVFEAFTTKQTVLLHLSDPAFGPQLDWTLTLLNRPHAIDQDMVVQGAKGQKEPLHVVAFALLTQSGLRSGAGRKRPISSVLGGARRLGFPGGKRPDGPSMIGSTRRRG